MTAAECADYLRVKTSWLYQKRAQQKIPYIKIGNKVVFDKAEIDSWIQSNKVYAKGEEHEEKK